MNRPFNPHHVGLGLDGFDAPSIRDMTPIAQPRTSGACFRTLFTTEHEFDAHLAGFDGPTPPGQDGGFAVHFDGRGEIPSVVIVGSDGQVEVCGVDAIMQLTDALMKAEQLVRAMKRAA
jgi:hypothetical protein